MCIRDRLFPDDTHLEDEEGNIREDAVQFVIHGIVDGTQLANHNIHLKGRKLPIKADTAGGGGTNGADSKAAKEAKDFSDGEISDL